MLITLPASAHGHADAASVLDLEPFLEFARQCRPDAVSLMPPLGADDQPNGAALLAIRDRLEAQGIGVVGGAWEVPEDAPVLAPAWQAQTGFEVRALIAALGEAGVQPLTVVWRAPCGDTAHREVLKDVLARLVDEAERAEVRLALQARLSLRELGPVLRSLDSPRLGLSAHVAGFIAPGHDVAQHLLAAGDRLFAVEASRPACALSHVPEAIPGEKGAGWDHVLDALDEIRFDGPFLIRDLASPLEYAHALGFFRGAAAVRTHRATAADARSAGRPVSGVPTDR